MLRTRQRQPFDERLPDGRSVVEALAGLLQPTAPTFPTGQPPLNAPPAPVPLPPASMQPPPYSIAPPMGGAPVNPTMNADDVFVGERTAGQGQLGKLQGQRRALQHPSGGDVRQTMRGSEIKPPEQSPSRLRQLLMGLAQGAVIGGQSGSLGGLIGGAATGAAAGGISPKLMMAFTRQQELDRNQQDINTELGTQTGIANLGRLQAQPELDLLRIQRQIQEDEYQQDDRIARQEQAVRSGNTAAAALAERRQGRIDRAAQFERQQAQRDEDQRRADARERRQQVRDDKIAAAKSTQKRTKLAEANRAEQIADSYEERAAIFRQQAGEINVDVMVDGRLQADPNLTNQRRSYEQKAEQAERAAAQARMKSTAAAEAADLIDDSESAAEPRKSFNLKRWKADHPNATPQEIDEIIARANRANMRIKQ